jgi:DNA-binding MarR family transcriptional regulator/N-acetylglutamate synthase-like GNAT family acetyltransferase
MKKESIDALRQVSRKLIRELGLLQLNTAYLKKKPQHWHALIEIGKEPGMTTSKVGILLLLSISAASRVVNALIAEDLVSFKEGADKREKYLYLTEKGRLQLKHMDDFSNIKIKGAFEFLTEDDQEQIINAIQKYANALEKSREVREHIKIHTLSTSRAIRKQIVVMIEDIQKNEFLLPITEDLNATVLRAEEDFYYNNSYNFWYAVDAQGIVMGSIGLKQINAHTAEIKKFFVAKNYRGKGVSSKLMTTLIKAAIKHQFDQLYLGTVSTLHVAHGFYKKYGFKQIPKEDLPPTFSIGPLDTVFFKVKVEELKHRLSQQDMG